MKAGGRALVALACVAMLGGCGLFRHRRRPMAPPVAVHIVVGDPYLSDGVFQYPRAQFAYDRAGLAVVLTRHGPATADGAPWDAGAMVAAHPTLQLPAVVRVTNLETGRNMLLRLDDRGPLPPGRLLGLSTRAAALLGPGSEPGVLRVRVVVDEALSRAVTAQAGGIVGDTLALAAAPTATVTASDLPPPPGIGTRAGRSAPPTRAIGAVPETAAATVPLRLPEQVTQGAVRPGTIYVEAGTFSRPEYARLLVARLAGQGAALSTSYAANRDEAFRVRIGPLSSVAEADAALDRALRAGVVGARIIVD